MKHDDYPGKQPERNRAAIRRVLALAPDELPPGPAHPTQACPLCDALIESGPAALRRHKEDHARQDNRARRRQAAANQRAAVRRLQAANARRRADLEDADAVELAAVAGRTEEAEPAPFTPAPTETTDDPEHGEQEQLTL